MNSRPFSRSLFSAALGFALLSGTSLRADPVGDEMAAAANAWLASLTDAQRAKASFDLKDEERLNWHYIPRARKGLPLKELSPGQLHLAHGLINSGLSHRGYWKATSIMSLEEVLHELEKPNGRMVRDSELYYLSIFAKPASGATWGWRLEGHHLSMNFGVAAGNVVSTTPSMLGTNPAEIRVGPRKGLRVLAAEEDLARKLVLSFSAKQRSAAIYTNVAPADILSEAKRKADRLHPEGISSAALDTAQRELLMQVIREFVQRYRHEIADTDLARIRTAAKDKLFFAWAGPLEAGKGHYYRVQGPSFLIEYDNTQNDANHIHAVWRDLDRDFGGDVLLKHYSEVPHAK